MTTRNLANRFRLFADDIAEIFSEEAGKPVQRTAVLSYIRKSRPATETRQAGAYAKNPMREPTGWLGTTRAGNPPYWEPLPGETPEELIQAFRDWWNSRPGKGWRGERATTGGRS